MKANHIQLDRIKNCSCVYHKGRFKHILVKQCKHHKYLNKNKTIKPPPPEPPPLRKIKYTRIFNIKGFLFPSSKA